MTEKEICLEERLEHIEKIIEEMETGKATLDEMFALYQSGLEEIKEANELLDKLEKTMLVINQEGDLEEFI